MTAKRSAKKSVRPAVSTIEGLAVMIADMHAEHTEHFARIDERFERLEAEMRGGFAELKRQLDRIETRIAALELAVFGAAGASSGGRIASQSILGRLLVLERAVFKNKK